MEKKTIGKFIAVLRKANGMTQKELGERLFVSDKTVSRWERDECTPELSLIPVMAEIFGVTTDELLRGERIGESSEPSGKEGFYAGSPKGDKQFRFMLHNRVKKYRMLTLITIGIAILGLIAAMIANLAFSEGLIGFCLAAVCVVASAICQIIFAANAYLLADEEDIHAKEIREANTKVTAQTVKVFFFLVAVFTFCLPIAIWGGANFGLLFEFWLPYGAIAALLGVVVSHILYQLWIKNLLIERGYIILCEGEKEKDAASRQILKKMFSILLAVLLLLAVLAFVFNLVGVDPYIKKEIFQTPQEFKGYVEAEYDRWFEHGYYYVDEDGAVTVLPPSVSDRYEDEKEYASIEDAQGNIICTYYYNPDLYRSIEFSDFEDKMPVTVITQEAYGNGWETLDTILSVIAVLCVLDVLVCAGIYLIQYHKIYQR